MIPGPVLQKSPINLMTLIISDHRRLEQGALATTAHFPVIIDKITGVQRGNWATQGHRRWGKGSDFNSSFSVQFSWHHPAESETHRSWNCKECEGPSRSRPIAHDGRWEAVVTQQTRKNVATPGSSWLTSSLLRNCIEHQYQNENLKIPNQKEKLPSEKQKRQR